MNDGDSASYKADTYYSFFPLASYRKTQKPDINQEDLPIYQKC